VATPIEAQMTGVDNMLYMYSTSTTSGGQMSLRVAFDVSTDPSTDEVLAQMRYSQAASQLPPQVTTQGVTVKKSTASPLAIFALYSPKGTYDPLFISNYAYVNINDPMTRVPGIGQVQISGAGQYAMRFWCARTRWPSSRSRSTTSSAPSRPRTPSTPPARSAAIRFPPASSSRIPCGRRGA
jgi:HAE1 family hydrophobic/amphiphilic exporter-1